MTSSRSSHRSPRVEARRPRRNAGARSERLEITLDGLRQIRDRAKQQQLEPDDYPLIIALLSNQVARAEGRQERMIAKIVAAAAVAEDTSGPGPDAGASSDADESTSSSSSSGSGTSATSSSSSSNANARSGEAPETSTYGNGKTHQSDSKEVKGHGRNGASAYRQAQHYFHALALGVIGAQCEACRLAKMSRYREKIVIRIIGQPLFGAQGHHYEQARCRSCGHIVRARGPDDVDQGLGTDYIRYDWSACAMLMVMHYFGGAPFKRIEYFRQQCVKGGVHGRYHRWGRSLCGSSAAQLPRRRQGGRRARLSGCRSRARASGCGRSLAEAGRRRETA